MYRCIIVFQFLLINTYAQNNSINNISYPLQLNIGTGISFPTSVRKAEFDAAYSPSFTLFLSKQINPKSEIYSGLNLNGIGVRRTAPYIKYESYYAAVTLMYKYEISPNFNFETGLQHNIPFFSRFSKLNGDNASGREATIEKSFSKQLSFINGGISLKMNDQITIRALYSHPISPKQNFSFRIDTTSYNYSFRNNQVQLNITYTIPQIEKPKSEREISKILINDLKNGTLLVMLPPRSVIQENLINNGKTEDADFIDNKIREYVKTLIKISNTKFNFCQILFFMPDKLDQIKNHNFTNCFLDETLKINNALSISSDSKTMIAHLYFNENSLRNFYEKNSNEIFIDYILIKDAEDLKVTHPFPYEIYLDVNSGNVSKNSELLIDKLNLTLNNFYLKKKR